MMELDAKNVHAIIIIIIIAVKVRAKYTLIEGYELLF